MWYKIRPLLIILSVTLNVALVTAWTIGAFNKKPIPACDMKIKTGKIWCPLHRRLGLSDVQWRKIEPHMLAFHDSTRVRCDRMRKMRSGLIDLLASEQTDRKAIAAKQAEILAGQREMQEQVIDHLLAEKQFLTPEQITRLFQMMKEKSGCASGGNAALCPFPISNADSQFPIELPN